MSDPYHDALMLKSLYTGKHIRIPPVSEFLGDLELQLRDARKMLSSLKGKIDKLTPKISKEELNGIQYRCKIVNYILYSAEETLSTLTVDYQIDTKPMKIKEMNDVDSSVGEELR